MWREVQDERSVLYAIFGVGGQGRSFKRPIFFARGPLWVIGLILDLSGQSHQKRKMTKNILGDQTATNNKNNRFTY